MRVRHIIARWVKREEEALSDQFYGKTVSERFRGLRRSERNEAKLFLLAITPTILIGPFIGKWSEASFVGKLILAVTGIWMIGVILIGGYMLFRSVYRASRNRSN